MSDTQHEHQPLDESQPFDPARSYPGCGCHPKYATPGSVARESYEQWVRDQAAARHAAKAAARAAADQPTQTNQEPR